jgi:hypothetical protein
LCNPYYSSFFTTRRKNHSTVSQLLDALKNHQKIINANSSTKPFLSQEKPVPQKRLGDYINILVADDAGQFHNQTHYRSLCWIHEGRHYEKLSPDLDAKKQLEALKMGVALLFGAWWDG